MSAPRYANNNSTAVCHLQKSYPFNYFLSINIQESDALPRSGLGIVIEDFCLKHCIDKVCTILRTSGSTIRPHAPSSFKKVTREDGMVRERKSDSYINKKPLRNAYRKYLLPPCLGWIKMGLDSG